MDATQTGSQMSDISKMSAIEACNDLSRRVLANEDVSAEEINAVLTKIREERATQLQTPSGTSKKPKVDTSALLSQLMGGSDKG